MKFKSTTPVKKLEEDSVTKEEINSDVAGTGLGQNVDGSLEVNVDDTTIEIISDILKLKDDGVTADKINADVAGSGLVQNGGTGALDIFVDDATIEHQSGIGLRVKDSGIVTAKINNDAVTAAKLNSDTAGLGLTQAVGGELDVNVDGSTIEISTDTVQVKANGITNTQIASNTVTSTEVDFLKDTPDASSVLEVESTTKGSIPLPKMTETQRDTIASPVSGLHVFNTTTNKQNYYDGTAWIKVGDTKQFELNVTENSRRISNIEIIQGISGEHPYDDFSNSTKADTLAVVMDAESTGGTTTINVESTTGFNVGEYVDLLHLTDNTKHERAKIQSIGGGNLTATGNLTNTYPIGSSVKRTSVTFSNGRIKLDPSELGDGRDGSVTISTSKNIDTDVIGSLRSTNADGIVTKVTSNPSTTTISVASSVGFAQGDRAFLINLQGASGDITDVGNYEEVIIESITNATTIEIITAPTNSYDGTTFSAQDVVLQRIPQYSSVTINNGGTLTCSAWSGTSGGIIHFLCQGTLTVNSGGIISATGKGYVGGTSGGDPGQQGESRTGIGTTSTSANDGGGGGGAGGSRGGGGGYGTVGTTSGGTGGGTYGSTDLSSTLFLGSGGGNASGSPFQDGGDGGGIIFIKSDVSTVNGSIESRGETNYNSSDPAGSGSGGSVYLKCNTLTFTGIDACIQDENASYTDETTDANSTANADVQIINGTPTTNSRGVFGSGKQFSKVLVDYANGTAGVGGTHKWQYWNGSWTDLGTVLTDDSSFLTAAVGDGKVLEFVPPSDWANTTINGQGPYYYIRIESSSGAYTTAPALDQVFIEKLLSPGGFSSRTGTTTTDGNGGDGRIRIEYGTIQGNSHPSSTDENNYSDPDSGSSASASFQAGHTKSWYRSLLNSRQDNDIDIATIWIKYNVTTTHSGTSGTASGTIISGITAGEQTKYGIGDTVLVRKDSSTDKKYLKNSDGTIYKAIVTNNSTSGQITVNDNIPETFSGTGVLQRVNVFPRISVVDTGSNENITNMILEKTEEIATNILRSEWSLDTSTNGQDVVAELELSTTDTTQHDNIYCEEYTILLEFV